MEVDHCGFLTSSQVLFASAKLIAYFADGAARRPQHAVFS
jgi:hypothetical protein